jgi:hypothetical protein
LRPAAPIISTNATIIGINSSQIQAVPPFSDPERAQEQKSRECYRPGQESEQQKHSEGDFSYGLHWTSKVSVTRHERHDAFSSWGAWPFSM